MTQLFPNRALVALLVALVCLSHAAALASGKKSGNPEYDQAKIQAAQVTDSLQSYEIRANLQMEQKAPGAAQGMKFEATQVSAAQMPDRLAVTIESPMFVQTWGTGAESSWFYFAQQQVCYVGQPAPMKRELGGEPSPGLDENEIYNFYAGIGEYLLTSEVAVSPTTGTETLSGGGLDIACQVFDFQVRDEMGADKGHGAYWYDPQSGLVLKAAVTTVNNQGGREMEGTMTSTITSFILNQKVDESMFTYTPPAEARVVDSFEKLMNPDSMVGDTAPDISFITFDGQTIKLSDYRGKVVFLDFWTTWCGPCRMEMPHIQKLHDEMKAAGDVVFIGASNEPQATIQGWLEKNPYTFKIVMVKPEDAQGKFRVTSIPAGFVIDRQGTIRAHMIGAQSEGQLRAALGKAGIK